MFDPSIIVNAPYGFWIAGGLATFLVAMSKSGFGGAMGSLGMPIMLTVLSPGLTLAVLLPVFLVCDIYVGWKYRRLAVRRLIIIMFVAGCVGQLAGWLLYQYISEAMLVVCIGLLAIFTGGRYFLRLYRPVIDNALQREKLVKLRREVSARASLWCGLSGLSSFVSLTGGIPAQVFLLPLRLPRAYYVGTMGWFFLLINLAKLPFFVELGLFNAASLTASLALVPIVPFGVMLGLWLNRTMSDKWFYHISHGFLLALGIRLIIIA
jgi:uncharacterized membrane protein YfcA